MPAFAAAASSNAVIVVRVHLPRLRPVREAAGLPLRTLGTYSGVPFRRIHLIECGLHASLLDARALAAALRVSLEELQ